jgi:hypothetical protein
MTPRRHLLAALALALAPALASAQSAAPAAPASPTVEGSILLGGIANDTSGSKLRVGEYDVLGNRPVVGIDLWGGDNGIRFDLQGRHGGDANDQKYSASIDLKRLVKAHVSYQRFLHRTDHDGLGYMDSVSNIGGTFGVQHTDTDPGAEHQRAYSELNARVDVSLPTAVPVKLFVAHRMQMRDGNHQIMTTSHCSSCHTVSFTRKLDEQTRDLIAGAMVQAKALTVDYRFEARKFKDDSADPTYQYANAIHPASLLDVFLNRVQYDDGAGLLPVGTVPGLTKNLHSLRAALALPRDASLVGILTKSNTRNDDTRLEIDYTGVSGRLVVPVSSRITFRADARRYAIESDDVFVDVVELVAPAGPSAGLTYRQAFPTMENPDFVRKSSLSRTPTEMNAELSMRLAKKSFLRAGYMFENVERDNFDVEKTTTNTFYLAGRSTFGKKAAWRYRAEHSFIKDPFMYEHAATPAILQPSMSPGNVPFTGLQYFQMYDSRSSNLTAFPTSSTKLENTFTWTPNARASVSGHYRFRSAQNDELQLGDWSRAVHAPGIDLWFAPGERWTLAAGYSYQRERLETVFSTLAFVG